MGKASQRKEQRRQVWLRTELVKKRACPTCHTRLDGATSITLDEPGPAFTDMPEGSATVCIYCGTLLAVEHGQFRLLTPEEFAELDPVSQQLLTTLPRLSKPS